MANTTSPKAILLAGIETLDPVMTSAGLRFAFEAEGKLSGKNFAWGRYLRADRSLELHFRYSLGLVHYHVAATTLDHENYMRLLGVYGRSEYPNFSSDPLDAFACLSRDLTKYCEDFLSGDGKQFREFAAMLKANPKLFKGLPA
jgi:hypothetical protein